MQGSEAKMLLCTCITAQSCWLYMCSVSRKGRNREELYICWLKSIERITANHNCPNYCPISIFFVQGICLRVLISEVWCVASWP